MFAHLYKYKFLWTIKNKNYILWTLTFPIILATLFYMGFGGLMNGNENKFNTINVALVTNNTNEQFIEIIKSLDNDNENNSTKLFNISYCDNEDNALDLLKNGDVKVIIYEATTPFAKCLENGINKSITQSFLNEYITQAEIIKDVFINHPEKLQATIDTLSKNVTYGKQISLAKGDFDPYIQYFYALITMVCLYASHSGASCVNEIQANKSEVGIRCNISPIHKFKLLLTNFLVVINVCFLAFILLVLYIQFVLKINIGSRIPFILLTGLVGDIIGASSGMLIAILAKNANIQFALTTGYSLICCFFSGLMIGNMKDIIEPDYSSQQAVEVLTDDILQ